MSKNRWILTLSIKKNLILQRGKLLLHKCIMTSKWMSRSNFLLRPHLVIQTYLLIKHQSYRCLKFQALKNYHSSYLLSKPSLVFPQIIILTKLTLMTTLALLHKSLCQIIHKFSVQKLFKLDKNQNQVTNCKKKRLNFTQMNCLMSLMMKLKL